MVQAADFAKTLQLTVLSPSTQTEWDIRTTDLNRPGMQFCGFYEYFPFERPQVIGKVEMTYLENLEPEVRRQMLKKYFSFDIPCVIICRGMHPPEELLEAAEIDGASKWTVFIKMVVPLSRSIMAVMVVYSMVAYWNDWFTALIYLRADQAPLPLVLRNILIKSSTSASQSSMVSGGFAELNKLTEMVKFASIIVAAAPMLIVYPFVQKYFEKGFMAGAVKG